MFETSSFLWRGSYPPPASSLVAAKNPLGGAQPIEGQVEGEAVGVGFGIVVGLPVVVAVYALVELDLLSFDDPIEGMVGRLEAFEAHFVDGVAGVGNELAQENLAVGIERMGDEASKVAKMAIVLSEEGESPRGYVEVRHIGEHVSRMVRDSLDAFARFDANKALSVMKEDKSVDNEYKTATRSLVTFMMEDPRSISQVLSVMWVLRALERIGDHACNVAEHVIYMVKGKDVRHISVELAEKAIEGKR